MKSLSKQGSVSLPAHKGLHISMHNRLDAAGTSLEPEGHQGPRVPEPNLKNRDHFSAKSPRARLRVIPGLSIQGPE